MEKSIPIKIAVYELLLHRFGYDYDWIQPAISLKAQQRQFIYQSNDALYHPSKVLHISLYLGVAAGFYAPYWANLGLLGSLLSCTGLCTSQFVFFWTVT